MNVIEKEELNMAGLYWKRPIEITHGSGVNLWDRDGNKYIDCTSNYGVAITGHCHPHVVEAVQRQAEKLLSCHGTFYNEARSEFLEKLISIAPKGLDKAFLSNSGTESVEFALKLARRSTGKPGIISMMGGFHGKTMGSLSATWNKKYREPFMPLIPGFKHVPYGNLERLIESIDEEVGTVLVEPIQGESGINVPPEGYLKGVKEVCEDKGILLILDEIQTGLGRTGTWFACQKEGVTPNIMCLSKAVASGLPMGVTLAEENVMSKLKMGEHSSTFGGGPLACAAAAATIDVLKEGKLPEKAADKGEYLMKNLSDLESCQKIIREVRGRGLMIGLELRFDVLNVIMETMKKKLLVLDAGRNVVRLLPPLIIEREQIDAVVSVLDEVLGEEQSARFPG
jgi:acetylornithine/LysW-gamma-L-lysine aminotransferase